MQISLFSEHSPVCLSLSHTHKEGVVAQRAVNWAQEGNL